MDDALKSMQQDNPLPFFLKTPLPNSSTIQLTDVYNTYNASAISLEEVPIDKVERYGIIKGVKLKRHYNISALVEKPPKEKAPPNPAIMDRHVPTPDIFDKINKTEPGVGGEIPLTDAFKSLIQLMESHSKVKPMTSQTGLNGLRHQSSLPLMTMSSGIIWWSI